MKNTRRVRVCDMEETFFRAPSRKRRAPYLLRFAQTAPLGRESGGPDGEKRLWYKLWSAGKRENSTKKIKKKLRFLQKISKNRNFFGPGGGV